MLDQLGYQFDVVGSGEEALLRLSSAEYDLILTDCEMPGMSGYELSALIRGSSQIPSRQIPILAMTAHAGDFHRKACEAAGMNDHLTKPIQMTILEHVLDRWSSGILADTAGDPAPTQAQSTLEAPLVSTVPAFSDVELIERMMGNHKLAGRVVGGFLDDMPRQLAALAKAVRDADCPATAAAAHAIRGAAGNAGAVAVQLAAKRLEAQAGDGDMKASTLILDDISNEFSAVEPQMRSFHENSNVPS